MILNSSLKILIVDDDAHCLRSIQDALALLGYDSESFVSPRDALQDFREKKYDVVITDYKMPEYSGLDLLDEMLAIRPSTKIIVISGYSTEALENSIEEKGAYAVMHKPLSCQKLLDHLHMISPPVEEHSVANGNGNGVDDALEPMTPRQSTRGKSDTPWQASPEHGALINNISTRAEQSHATMQQNTHNPGPADKPLIVLIIDCNEIDRQHLKQVLAQEEFHVFEAESGQSAIEALQHLIPDMILLETALPDMTGIELCRILHQTPATSDIPIIFLSALDESDAIVQCFEAGGRDFLAKPYKDRELLARVASQKKVTQQLAFFKNSNTKLQLELEFLTNALAQSEKHATMGLFVEGIVHDTKQHLSIIDGSTQLIKQKLAYYLPEEQTPAAMPSSQSSEFLSRLRKHIATIERTVSRFNTMLLMLLGNNSWSRINHLIQFDLNTLIRDELNIFNFANRYKYMVSKSIHLSSDQLLCWGIPSMIGQVFQNVVWNALHATHDQADPQIIIRSGQNETGPWFTVSDNGCGISDNTFPFIYEPYFTTKPRQDVQDPDAPTGTGLGLYLSRKILQLHNGSITLQNMETGGVQCLIQFSRLCPDISN